MKRALELVEPLPAKIEDCFAHFDKVFDSLAAQLEWQDADAARTKISDMNDRPEPPAAPAVPATQIALVQPKPLPAPPAAESTVDVLQQYERAFSVLDDRLAESDPAEVTAIAKRPNRLPSDRRPASYSMQASRLSDRALAEPKRVRRTLDDAFGMVESLNAARRRGNFAEERQGLTCLLADTRQLCADLDLCSARVRVEFAVLTLESEHFDKVGSELDELVRHVRYDLRSCSIGPARRPR